MILHMKSLHMICLRKKNTNFENMMKLFYKFELEIKVFDFGL